MKKFFLVVCVLFLPIKALEIRSPLASEIEEIAELYYRAWHDTFDIITPYLSIYKTPENCLKLWQSYNKTNKKLVFLVACKDNKIVGVIYVVSNKSLLGAFEDSDCKIDKLYVLPENKKQGIGKALLQVSLAKLADIGFKKAILKSLTSNTNANCFYEHMGGILVEKAKFMHRETMNFYEFNLCSMQIQ